MSIQARIDALLAKADPLRPLDEDDPRKEPLAGIVDEINRLRAEQSEERIRGSVNAVVEGADHASKEAAADADEAVQAVQAGQAQEVLKPKRGPGRPKKADK